MDPLSVTASIIAILQLTNKVIGYLRHAQSQQDHKAVMEWLSPSDFPAQQDDIISRREKGTGQWFLDSVEFKSWLEGNSKTLFCHGMPEAGKTMMAAIAIDHLCRMAQAGVGLAYLFCSYKSQFNQNLHGLLCAILKQLVQSRMDISAPVTRLYDHHMEEKSRPPLDDIFKALITICSNYTGVCFVVDALDECSNQNGTRRQLIENLRNLQAKTNVRLLFTSRSI